MNPKVYSKYLLGPLKGLFHENRPPDLKNAQASLQWLAKRTGFKTNKSVSAELGKLDAVYDAAIASLATVGKDRVKPALAAAQRAAVDAVASGKPAPEVPSRSEIDNDFRRRRQIIKQALRDNTAKAASIARPEVERFAAEASKFIDSLDAEHEKTAIEAGVPHESPAIVNRLRWLIRDLRASVPDEGSEQIYLRPSSLLRWE